MLGFHQLGDNDRTEKQASIHRELLVLVLLAVLALASRDQLTNNNEIKYSCTDKYHCHIS